MATPQLRDDWPQPGSTLRVQMEILYNTKGIGGLFLFHCLDGDSPNWSGTNVTLSDDAVAKYEGKTSLKIVVAGGAGDAERLVDIDEKKWSPYTFELIFIRANDISPIRLRAESDSDPANYYEWNIAPINNGLFNSHQFLLDTPDASGGVFNPDNVTKVQLLDLVDGKTYYFDVPELIVRNSVLDETMHHISMPGGRELANGCSIENALGHDGTTEYDEGISGKLGINNAVNAYDSSLIISDRDGSLFERTEFIIDRCMGIETALAPTAAEVKGEASADGTTTTLVDSTRTEADNYFIGQVIYFYNVLNNNGVSRVITDWDLATTTFTFAPALVGGITKNGDMYVILPDPTDPQVDDIYTRIGAPVGASISADIADVNADALVNLLLVPGKSAEVQVDVTLPDIIGTPADLFDGGATIDNQIPASFYASWNTDAQANVHLLIDLVNMAGGDTITIRFYKLVKTTARQIAVYSFTGVQTNPIQEHILMCTTTGYIKASIEQSAGVARVVPTSHYADLGKNKRT